MVQARLDTTTNSSQPGVDKNGMAERENLADGTDGRDLSTVGYSARWHERRFEDAFQFSVLRQTSKTLREKAKASMPVALAAWLRWNELTCASSCMWYGVLGGETG